MDLRTDVNRAFVGGNVREVGTSGYKDYLTLASVDIANKKVDYIYAYD